MPIRSFTNYAGIAPRPTGIGDILENALAGYKMQKEPARMKREASREEQLIEQLLLGNESSRIENQFLPTKLQQLETGRGYENEASRLNLEALPQKIQDDILTRALNIKRKEKDLSWTDALNEALLNQRKASAERVSISDEQKKQDRMQEFIDRENIKNQMKKQSDLTEITPTTRTKYQNIIREVNSIMPVMKELVEHGGESYTGIGTASDLKYLGKIKRIADVYMKAKSWPNTDTARKDAIQLFKRGSFETAKQYKSRMKELEDELKYESSLATNALKGGRSEVVNNSSENNSHMFKGIINGKEYDVHPQDKEDFIAMGGQI